MGILWMGASHGLRLFENGRITAWGTVNQVDWSVRGSGLVLSLWQDDRVRVLSREPALATWLIETFIAPMSRAPSQAADGVAWGPVELEAADVELTVDLDAGLRACAGEIVVELADPLDRQLVYRDPYEIEGERYRVSFVNVPCARGTISVGGTPLPGLPRRWTDESGRLRSTGQIAVAEVWSPPGA
jgi:hypothetical protein